jgi:hypothetical protein
MATALVLDRPHKLPPLNRLRSAAAKPMTAALRRPLGARQGAVLSAITDVLQGSHAGKFDEPDDPGAARDPRHEPRAEQ